MYYDNVALIRSCICSCISIILLIQQLYSMQTVIYDILQANINRYEIPHTSLIRLKTTHLQDSIDWNHYNVSPIYIHNLQIINNIHFAKPKAICTAQKTIEYFNRYSVVIEFRVLISFALLFKYALCVRPNPKSVYVQLMYVWFILYHSFYKESGCKYT